MRNYAFISLSALKSNAEEIKKHLSPTTKFCAVVKADAYGHGAEKCANALYPLCDSFAVAIVEEGIRLRLSGIDKDILVLTPPFTEDLCLAIENRLTLTAESLDGIRKIESVARNMGNRVKVHIKYDTGMRRFGVKDSDGIKAMLDFCADKSAIEVDGIYTHLFNPTDDKVREKQIGKFLLANKLVKDYNKNITAHVSASAGYLFGLEFDMVRIGLLLYGYKPFLSDKVSVKPVMKVYSPVIKEVCLKKGDNALYGERTAKKDENAFLVRYGYADGLPRAEYEEIFNDRCMDVSLYRGENNGKFFCVMKNADKLAEKYGTISYEILVRVGLRAERIYLN